MKKLVLLVSVLLFGFASVSLAVPAAPQLSFSTSGVNLSVNWVGGDGATNYTLYYAPYPYVGSHTINSVNMGGATSFSISLWDGASYYIAVTANNAQGESGFSNIELFQIENTSNNIDGIWTVTETTGFNTCEEPTGSTYSYNIQVFTNGSNITVVSPAGTFAGTLNGNVLQWSGSYPEDGGTTTIDQLSVTISEGGSSFTGTDTWSWSDGYYSCSGNSSTTGIKQ